MLFRSWRGLNEDAYNDEQESKKELQKLKDEFEEETGTPASNIKKIKSFCLVYDKINHVFDVGCIIELDYNVTDLINNFQFIEEYSDPILVTETQLREFISENRERIVPTSLALLECFLTN